MTNRWTPYAKVIDISRYQFITKDGWKQIKDGGVDCVIAKSGQGHWWKDTAFSGHVQNAWDVDIPILAYFWFEGKYYNAFGLDESNWPSPEDDRQVNKLFSSIANRKIYGLFIDEEDKDQVTPAWSIAACGQFAHRVRDRLSRLYGAEFPLGLYTGNWYWQNNKAPFAWMANKNLIQMGWVAIYPYSKTYVKTTWEDMWELHMPRDDYPVPTLNWDNWKFWQFSGDKFILPGIENGAGGPSALDLNLYNGTKEQLYKFLNFTPKPDHGDPPVEPPPTPDPDPEPEDLKARVDQLELDAMLMNTKIVELQKENNDLYIVNQEQNERIAYIETHLASFEK